MSEEIVDDIFGSIPESTRYEKIKYRIKYYIEETKYFFQKLYQRIKYGFPLEQSWDFCSYHSDWVLPRLKHLRADLHGHPTGMKEGEWEDILDKIIWSFENWEDEPGPIYPEDYDHRYLRKKEDGKITFTAMDSRSPDYSPFEEHRKRAKEGFLLFGEYYMHLWD